jgi:hypothetical protein
VTYDITYNEKTITVTAQEDGNLKLECNGSYSLLYKDTYDDNDLELITTIDAIPDTIITEKDLL